MAERREVGDERRYMSERALRACCAARGLAIARIGKAWRIYGNDVNICVASLHGLVSINDLEPVKSTRT